MELTLPRQGAHGGLQVPSLFFGVVTLRGLRLLARLNPVRRRSGHGAGQPQVRRQERPPVRQSAHFPFLPVAGRSRAAFVLGCRAPRRHTSRRVPPRTAWNSPAVHSADDHDHEPPPPEGAAEDLLLLKKVSVIVNLGLREARGSPFWWNPGGGERGAWGRARRAREGESWRRGIAGDGRA